MGVYLRVAKRLATEPHLPRPLRWLLVFAVLPIPGPVDEGALILAALMIAVFYRPRFKTVLAEERLRVEPHGAEPSALLRRGFVLEGVTLTWNVGGIVILAITALAARSVALAGFGLDSLIEIGASLVVIWELSGTGEHRQAVAVRLIGGAFLMLALYLGVQSTYVLVARDHPHHSALGIAWTAATAVVMFGLAAGKENTGRRLGNPVLRTEGRVTLVDGLLATAVCLGLALNTAVAWWWADPLAGYVILVYGLKEARGALSSY
jgi:hypothetical protein